MYASIEEQLIWLDFDLSTYLYPFTKNWQHPANTLFRWNASSLLSSLLFLLTDLASLTTSLKDLIKVILSPPDIWVQSSKLPLSINLLVPMLVCAVSMALENDLRSCLILVSLVRHTQLMPADDLVVRDLFELGGAAEVLGHEGFVAEDEGGGDHAEELVGWHGFP